MAISKKYADPAAKTPATAQTLYRVGSVSKLYTDVALMQLAEQGKIDLDAPVTKTIPELKPKNPFGKPFTLRQMTSHRSGLLREPHVLEQLARCMLLMRSVITERRHALRSSKLYASSAPRGSSQFVSRNSAPSG